MRISVLTLGTRGDTEPYVALGAGLRRAGHEVRIAALRRFEPLIADHGLDFVALPGDTSEMFRTEAWRQLVVRRWNWTAHVGALREMLQPLVDQLRPHVAAAQTARMRSCSPRRRSSAGPGRRSAACRRS